MAKRALGALLALAAAAAFVVAIVSSAWWSGHPVVNGRAISAKDVHVGLLGAEGCNTGGDGSCEAVEIGGAMKLATYADLGATGLAALLSLLVAIAAWRVADNRKSLAKASLAMTLLAAAGGGAVLALGPAIKASATVDVPIGWGLFVFIGAIASSLVASTIARNLEPEPLRLKPSNAPVQPPVQANIRQMIQNTSAEPAPRDSASLFTAAPQLRPLYDPNNAGYAPPPAAPVLPNRAPTPMPREQIERLTGKPQPQPRTAPPAPAHELDWSAPPTNTPSPQANATSSPRVIASPPPAPAPRSKPMTAPPPSPPRRPGPSAPPPVRPVVPAPAPRAKPPTTVPPPAAAPRQAKPRAGTIANAGATPAPERSALAAISAPSHRAQTGPRQPTVAHAVPPMPRASTENDDRLETGMRDTEYHTAVEVDHAAKAAAQHANRPATEDVRTGGNRTVGDRTDVGVGVAAQTEENTDVGVAPAPPNEPVDLMATIEQNPKTPVPTLDRAASVLGSDTPLPTRAQNVAMSTAPSSLPPPKQTDTPTSGPTPACPQCESPMAWVEEHLRFYCKSCRMYF